MSLDRCRLAFVACLTALLGACAGGPSVNVSAAEGAANKNAPTDPASQPRAAMNSANVDVGAILKDEFAKAAAAPGAFVVQAGSDPAPADLSLVVNHGGWARAHMLGASPATRSRRC